MTAVTTYRALKLLCEELFYSSNMYHLINPYNHPIRNYCFHFTGAESEAHHGGLRSDS